MSVTAQIKGGLVSVVLACRGPLPRTMRCLESLLRHSRRPWELIAVADATCAAYLLGIRDALPTHVDIVPPPPDAASFRHRPGLAVACGDYLALIDDSTIVFEDWLAQLVALVDSGPTIGMVGPMLNDAPPPQRAADSEDLEPAMLDPFADRWRTDHRREWFTTPRLADRCVLLRRPTFEAAGGVSADSIADLAARVVSRGLELAVGHDIFVYHDADGAALEPPAGALAPVIDTPWLVPKGTMTIASRPSARPRRDHGPGSRPIVSLTMIVRDEEDNLPDCLASVEGLCDEVIVVDTGSTDRTAEVARSLGAQVVPFTWVDDFAAARNVALDHASGRYAFWLDADERIKGADRDRLRDLLAGLADDNTKPSAYVMRQISPGHGGEAAPTSADHLRLFPLRDDIRWSYRVHEQIVPAIRAAGVPVEWTDIAIAHIGYVDEAVRLRKLERNFRILRSELPEKPGDPFVLFNIGWVAIESQEPRTALGYLRASLAASLPRDSIVRKAYVLIARAYQMLGDPRSALAACRAGRAFEPDDCELLFREALLRRELGDLGGAETCWRRILVTERPRRFTSLVSDIRGHITRRYLASLAEQRRDIAGALRYWDEVLAERPDDVEARRARARLAPPSSTVDLSTRLS